MRRNPYKNGERTYINACDDILKYGTDVKDDRTGVGTRMLTNLVIEHGDVEDAFPMMLSKRVAWRPMVGELLWFIRGSTNVRELAEITYGDPERETIWTQNYDSFLAKHFNDDDYPWEEGDLGPVYGAQWRSWDPGASKADIDQLADIVERIKENPSDRRLVVSAWNPGEIEKMALPPCHMIFQFNVVDGRYLDVAMFQRSGDMFLGVPFNLASYALLLKLVARETNLVARKVTILIGNAHIYSNHLEQVSRQINNWHQYVDGFNRSQVNVSINTSHSMFSDKLAVSDFELTGYEPVETIKGDMAV